MSRTVGISTIIRKDFKTFDLSNEWKAALGEISRPFRWLVYGRPKNGKTNFILQFCKEMSKHTKVYYNSVEEGISKTMQDHFIRLNMDECRPGKFMLGDREPFRDMLDTIERIKAQVIVIDSRDYMKLTTEQYKQLIRRFPKKKLCDHLLGAGREAFREVRKGYGVYGGHGHPCKKLCSHHQWTLRCRA